MSGVVADVAERLMAEFEGRVSPRMVSAVVCEVDRDLSGAAPESGVVAAAPDNAYLALAVLIWPRYPEQASRPGHGPATSS